MDLRIYCNTPFWLRIKTLPAAEFFDPHIGEDIHAIFTARKYVHGVTRGYHPGFAVNIYIETGEHGNGRLQTIKPIGVFEFDVEVGHHGHRWFDNG